MRLNGRDLLEAFGKSHHDAGKALNAWAQIMEGTQFKHLPHLKQSFGSADYKAPFTIFDIRGNEYRIAAIVNYAKGLTFVHKVMTHKEYDGWSKRLK